MKTLPGWAGFCLHLMMALWLLLVTMRSGLSLSAPRSTPVDVSATQRQIEDQYLHSHERQLLLQLADMAKAQKRDWLAASLYLSYLRTEDNVSADLKQQIEVEVSAVQGHAIRVFVFYQTQQVGPVTLRIGGRVVGALPLDGWILIPAGPVEISVSAQGISRFFHTEPLAAGPAPRTIVLTDFGPPIVSAGVTVAIDGQADVPSAAVPILQAALVSGVEANLVVALPAIPGTPLLRTVAKTECSIANSCDRLPAKGVGIRYLLRAKFEQHSEHIQGEISLFNLDANQRILTSEWECRHCSDGSLRTQLLAKVKELTEQALTRQTVSVLLDSEPSEAKVLVNGELRGVTPLRTQLLEGPQRIRVRKEGFLSSEQQFTLSEAFVSAQSGVLRFSLAPDVLAIRARRLSAAKWSMLGVGLAAIAVSGTLLALDGAQTCSDSALIETKTCPYVRSTVPGSYVGLALGSAALASFPILLGIEYRTRALQRERQ